MEVPRDAAESWYTHILRHFLSVLMSSLRRLEYKQVDYAAKKAGNHPMGIFYANE
jgi:hypothetical protein